MKNYSKGFTLAETMVVLVIIAIVSLASIGIYKSKSGFEQKMMYYAALKNLQTIRNTMLGINANTSSTTKTGNYDSTACKAAVDAYATMLDAQASADNCRSNQSAFPDDGHTSDCTSDDNYASNAQYAYNNALAATKIYNSDDGQYYTMAGIPYPTVETECGTGSPSTCSAQPISGVDWTKNCTYTYTTAASNSLPATGADLCKSILNLVNVIGETSCTAGASSTTSDFTNNTLLNFTTSNSQKYFNLNTNPTYGEGTYNASSDTPVDDYYKVFIDINGTKGKSAINDDVFAFYIFRDGLIIPSPDSLAWTSTNIIKASVRYVDSTTQKNVYILNNVSYQQAACTSGIFVPGDRKLAASNCGTYTTVDSHCTGGACSVIPTRPGW